MVILFVFLLKLYEKTLYTIKMIIYIILFISLIYLQIIVKKQKIKQKINTPDTVVAPETLSDLGHKMIPSISQFYILHSDIILVSMFLALFILIKSPNTLQDFFKKGSILLLLRSISICLTDLPQINNNDCKLGNQISKIVGGKCTNDYMFSGHTSMTLLISLFIMKELPYLQIPMLSITTIQIYIILATRMHYSIDIFIAILLTYLVYSSSF
jgi:hypothetical protein|uniref:Sphingomyelin synthase-like domain-containing protein n=1 Tax=viral metagenome TaxID=1070528 RepID=A0A6C0BSM1_9ZZZZ